MARQKLIATGEIVLPEGMDVFQGVKQAETAKTVLEQAEKEIKKTFPDFSFKFEVGTYRVPGSNPPGRRRGSTNATAATPPAGNGNAAAGAAAGAAPG